jgi:hypothetical protein
VGAEAPRGAGRRTENPPEISLANPAGWRYNSNTRIAGFQCGYLILKARAFQKSILDLSWELSWEDTLYIMGIYSVRCWYQQIVLADPAMGLRA